MRRALEFTLNVSDCLGCSFCPQEKLNAVYHGDRKMTFEVFCKILDQLPPDVEIHFSGFSEPFLNIAACEMMYEAKQRSREVHVYSTLMGFKPGCVDLLKVRKPDYFRVHVPDMKALVVPSEKWIKNHELFLSAEVPASYMSMGDPPPEIKLHLALNKIVVERPDMLSRGGNLWLHNGISSRMKCSMDRWHSNVVLPNGDVVGCCMDYALTVPLGNLLRDDYQFIHDQAERWRSNMERNPAGTICSKCEWATPA